MKTIIKEFEEYEKMKEKEYKEMERKSK